MCINSASECREAIAPSCRCRGGVAGIVGKFFDQEPLPALYASFARGMKLMHDAQLQDELMDTLEAGEQPEKTAE